MTGLLLKDLIIRKKMLLFIVPCLLVLSGWSVLAARLDPETEGWQVKMLSLFSSLIVFFMLEMMEGSLFSSDEMKKWQSWIACVPEGVKLQVGSKYLMSFLMTVTVFSVCDLFGALSGAILQEDMTGILTLISLLIWIQLFIRSVETPFLVAFGSKNGNSVRILLVLAVFLGAVVYGLFGDISFFTSEENGKNLVFWFRDFKLEANEYLLFIPAAVLVLYYVSYRISCRLYLKGGKQYDQ